MYDDALEGECYETGDAVGSDLGRLLGVELRSSPFCVIILMLRTW